jgi:hypothetical protein
MHDVGQEVSRVVEQAIQDVGALPHAAGNEAREEGNVPIRGMVVPNASPAAIADMLFGQETLFIHVPLGAIRRDMLPGPPELGSANLVMPYLK